MAETGKVGQGGGHSDHNATTANGTGVVGLRSPALETAKPLQDRMEHQRCEDKSTNGANGTNGMNGITKHRPALPSPLHTPKLPSASFSAPNTATLPTIPSDEETSSDDGDSTRNPSEGKASSESSTLSESAPPTKTGSEERKADVGSNARAAPMKKMYSQDNVRRLTAAEMQQLTATPESLPIAVVRESSRDRDRDGRLSPAELQAIRQSMLNGSSLSGAVHVAEADDGHYHHSSDSGRPSISVRTLSTPPIHRNQPSDQTSSPRRNSFHPTGVGRPPPLSLDGQHPLKPLPQSLADKGSLQPEPPPTPLAGPSIPLPPLSLPTHLQLELAAQRPSPLYIYQPHNIDVPYESSAIKFQRLKNVLLLPAYLERALNFGALACLDAWLHTFTILPIRFCLALGILVRWWVYVVAKEANWLVAFVWYGLGRVWHRARGKPRQDGGTGDLPQRRHPPADCAPGSVKDDATQHGHCPVTEDRPSTPPPITKPSEPSPAKGNGHVKFPPNTPEGPQRVFRHRRTKSMPSNLSSFHKADLLQGAIIIFTTMALMYLDASRMYHFIRGQSDVKLYVIYNILEIGDRLLSALGQDIFECLFSSETLSRNTNGRSKVLLPLGMFVLALAYNVFHSVVLYFQVITLNVAVNSYSNALLTLLMSNQFVEVKSTVFKKFEKDNLFQLTCADIVERFQLWIMLLIVGMRNIVEVGGLSIPGAGTAGSEPSISSALPLHSPSILPHSFTVLPSWLWSGEVLSPFFIVIGSEIFVDYIKHAYVTKFNNMKPTFYSRILDILCKDYYTNAFVTPSLTRRLGLAVIPLSCLFIRASVQTYHMFLSTHISPPLPPSTQTALSEESAVPSSPAMLEALDRLDTLIRDALGRSVYGSPYASSSLASSKGLLSWTSDDIIAALTMTVVFFLFFLVLLIFKLVLGMVLLSYSRNRYAKMKRKEALVNAGKTKRETWDVGSKRVGGYGHVEIGEERGRWIHADETEGLRKRGRGEREREREREKNQGEYLGVSRYEMIAKRIW